MEELLSEKFGVRVTPSTMATLREIEGRHGYDQTVMARKLLDAACQFYREHGYFHFPVVIEPGPIQIAAEQSQAAPEISPLSKAVMSAINPAKPYPTRSGRK